MPDEVVVVSIEDISKRFVIHPEKSLKERLLSIGRRSAKQDFWALSNVSLDIALGETVGLVGHNGSGKSTLLKMIGGILAPSSGRVLSRGRVAALLELGAGFHPDLTGRDNVFLNAAILGMSTERTVAAFDDIVEFSGIGEFIDTQVKFYSSGMYIRLAFAIAVHSDPDILLVDEVLAVGDEPFQAKCMAKIRQFQEEGRTIVFVSHSAEQIADVCTRVVVLDRGSIVHDGDVAAGIRALRATYAETAALARKERGLETALTISEVRLLDSDGTALDRRVLSIGDDLKVEIAVELHTEVDWVAGFTLATPLGQTVYRLNTEGLRLKVPTQPGRYLLTFILPATNFSTKRLVLSVGATTRGGLILDQIDPAGQLDVHDDPSGAGMLQFHAQGTLEPVSRP